MDSEPNQEQSDPNFESEVSASLTRRSFVTGLGAFVASQILLPSILRGAVLSKELKPLRLGFLTDCHAMGRLNAPAWLAQSAQLINSLKPDLIIGGGDFVDGGFYNTGKKMNEHWKLANSFLKRIKTRLEPVIGNHDFYEPVQKNGFPSAGDPRWRFKKQFGLERTYRSFEFRGYRFLILDSVKVIGGPSPYMGWISSNQLRWLDQELERIPCNQPIILCTHIPFKTSLNFGFGSFLAPSSGRVTVLNSSEVMSKLRNRPLVAILQGHVHINEKLELEGVPCITGGAVCGNWWRGPNMGTNPGLGMIEIIPAGPTGSIVPAVRWNYTDTPAPALA